MYAKSASRTKTLRRPTSEDAHLKRLMQPWLLLSAGLRKAKAINRIYANGCRFCAFRAYEFPRLCVLHRGNTERTNVSAGDQWVDAPTDAMSHRSDRERLVADHRIGFPQIALPLLRKEDVPPKFPKIGNLALELGCIMRDALPLSSSRQGPDFRILNYKMAIGIGSELYIARIKYLSFIVEFRVYLEAKMDFLARVVFKSLD